LLVGPPDDHLLPYEPLVEETGLFLTFAGLDGQPDALLRFANEFGRLGTYFSFWPEGGEPLYEWQRHHQWMRILADVRSECAKKRSELDDFVRWEGDEVVFSFPPIGTGRTETWRHRGQLRKRLLSKKGTRSSGRATWSVRPAGFFAMRSMTGWKNCSMAAGRSPPAWSGRTRRAGRSSSSPQQSPRRHGGPVRRCAARRVAAPGLRPLPPRLSPATGGQPGQPAHVLVSCKQYLHNRRVQRARELHAEGRSLRQIAKELQVKPRGEKSAVEMVQGWIARE
jgi:hypothetical protein